MSQRCSLSFRRNGFIQQCDRPYGHNSETEPCQAGNIVRETPSPTGLRRWQDAQGILLNPQAATPPVEPKAEPKVYDPRKQPREFLNQQHGLSELASWNVHYMGDWGVVVRSGAKEQVLPFCYTKSLHHCCGVTNIDCWTDASMEASRVAAFTIYMEYAKTQMGAMCLIATTVYSQTAANKLLREFGFKEIHGHNSNSGNDMSLWVYRLHEAGDHSADEHDDDDYYDEDDD